jgi:Flp pilus assembly protein TadD
MDTQVMLGLAPVAARPHATSALVIGWGTGVTARAVADAPGMQRLRVVEIEPAVIAAGRFFESVNGKVLERPGVSLVVDDARSALQLHRERFDLIVSEPSNPWVAGIATLYTPEFLRIVRSRLADDGVLCQWIQLYQLPLPVVAGIVRNVRAVFPHVEVWFGSPHDLIVLASPQPLRYDRAWLDRLLGPGGSHTDLAREWLSIDRPGDYFGRFLLADSGAARLAARGALVHTDDRPALEFAAARRFLDREGYNDVLDSIIGLAGATDAPTRSSRALLAKALTARRGDPRGLGHIEAALQGGSTDAELMVRAGLVYLVTGDSAAANRKFAQAIARERHPEALIATGLMALRSGETARARSQFLQALALGGDTAEARAGLAVLAARDARWSEAAAEARRSVAAALGTFRRPFPFGPLGDALNVLAERGPPALADSVLSEALAREPGWPRLYELRAVTAVRAGRCDAAVEDLVQLFEFGILRSDAPALLARCRRGVAS